MARVLFTAAVADIRGKMAGTVFSKNRSGAYIRTKVTPSNPQTSAQVEQRSLLSYFSKKWRGLTQDQRDAWAGAVGEWQRTNIFGNTVNPSGQMLYNRLNMAISVVGGSEISVPSVPTGVATPTDFSVAIDTTVTKMLVTFAETPVPADTALIIEATAPQSPGINNANNKYRQIAILAPATATGEDIWTAYVNKFGAPVKGKKVFFRAGFGSKVTGERSQMLKFDTIVTV